MAEWLRELVRTIPDYPKPGVQFRDVTTLLKDAKGFRKVVDELVQPFVGTGLTKVAGIEARGFIIGGALAHQLGVGFVPIRKSGKLPGAKIGVDYALEYGVDRLEIHADAVGADDVVLVVDDLIATGGTVIASIDLIRRAGATVAGAAFILNLPDLGGEGRVESLGCPVHSLCNFAGH